MKRLAIALGALGIVVMVGCWKTKPNPAYCDGGECERVDGGGDLSKGDLAGACTMSSQCQGTSPVCDVDAGLCAACKSNTECTASGTPACATTGACVECVQESDCTMKGSACIANACKPCTLNTDCASGICDQGESKCIDASTVVYVDNTVSKCSPSGPGKAMTPFCRVNDVFPSLGTGPSYIKVAGSAGLYDAIVVPPNQSLTVMIVGPGKAAAQLKNGTGSQFLTNGSPAVSFSPAAGMTSTVIIDGLELLGATAPSPQAGIYCTGPGTAVLTVRDSYIHDSGAEGVNSTCALTLERNLITENKGGVTVNGGTYTIENNFIVSNSSSASGGPMVSLGGATSGLFQFNTVAGNTTANLHVAGIDCGGGSEINIVASIVVGNTNTQSGASQFFGNCSLSKTVTGTDTIAGGIPMTPMFASTTGDYHLSTMDTVCVDQAGNTGPALDYDDQARPKGNAFDIGADEAK